MTAGVVWGHRHCPLSNRSCADCDEYICTRSGLALPFQEYRIFGKGITYTFTGADSVKVMSKPRWQPDGIKDVSKVSDEQLFKKYSI